MNTFEYTKKKLSQNSFEIRKPGRNLSIENINLFRKPKQIETQLILSDCDFENLIKITKKFYPNVLNSIFCIFTKNITLFDVKKKIWYYKDPQSNSQGPFNSLEMDIWLKFYLIRN